VEAEEGAAGAEEAGGGKRASDTDDRVSRVLKALEFGAAGEAWRCPHDKCRAGGANPRAPDDESDDAMEVEPDACDEFHLISAMWIVNKPPPPPACDEFRFERVRKARGMDT